MGEGRIYKVIRNGRTTTAGTHTFHEAAEALAEARVLGDCFELRIQLDAERERFLTELETQAIAAAAAEVLA